MPHLYMAPERFQSMLHRDASDQIVAKLLDYAPRKIYESAATCATAKSFHCSNLRDSNSALELH